MNSLYPCPCCGEKTFSQVGEFDICYVCKWEYDPLQSEDPYDNMGANMLCLNDYRKQCVTRHNKIAANDRLKIQSKIEQRRGQNATTHNYN